VTQGKIPDGKRRNTEKDTTSVQYAHRETMNDGKREKRRVLHE
jgi:hypothetical protein